MDRLVTVFASSDLVAVAMAKLALDSGGVPYVTKGELVQDYIGVGRLFGGVNLATGPVQIQVRPEDAETAIELIHSTSE